MSDEVAVLGVGAFVPGFDGLKGWAASEPNEEHVAPRAELIPKRQRRRASSLSKALADAFSDALESSGLEPSLVASVFGSAIGEASTMVGLLDQMWSETGMLSPMRFATSVHNAASGVISIATENRGMTTAIGADFDTPAMALMEGIGLVLARGESVIVCCGDEAPPTDLVPEGSDWAMMTAAIAIGPAGKASPTSPRISKLAIGPATIDLSKSVDADSGGVADNPNVGLLDLAVAIHRGLDGVLPLDRGAGRGYSIRLTKGDLGGLDDLDGLGRLGGVADRSESAG
jgi:hypothetical protein